MTEPQEKARFRAELAMTGLPEAGVLRLLDDIAKHHALQRQEGYDMQRRLVTVSFLGSNFVGFLTFIPSPDRPYARVGATLHGDEDSGFRTYCKAVQRGLSTAYDTKLKILEPIQ